MSYFQLQRQKRVLSKILIFITPLLFLVALGLTYYLLVYRIGVFNISAVEVLGAKTFVNETDLREIVKNRAYGKNIISFDSTELEESLKETFQGARTIGVSKKFPATLTVLVTERTPIAIVYKKDFSNIEFLVDDSGYVLGQIAPGTSNLPKILYDGNIEVGYFLDTRAVSVYFELLKALDEEGVSVSSASINPDHLLVFVKDSAQVLVGLEKDVAESARLLSQLLQQLASQGKNPGRVDLRFDKVVVSYN